MPLRQSNLTIYTCNDIAEKLKSDIEFIEKNNYQMKLNQIMHNNVYYECEYIKLKCSYYGVLNISGSNIQFICK